MASVKIEVSLRYLATQLERQLKAVAVQQTLVNGHRPLEVEERKAAPQRSLICRAKLWSKLEASPGTAYLGNKLEVRE